MKEHRFFNVDTSHGPVSDNNTSISTPLNINTDNNLHKNPFLNEFLTHTPSHHEMTPHDNENQKRHITNRNPSLFGAVLITLLTLILSACHVDAAFNFKTDGSVQTEIIFEDNDNFMQQLNGKCSELKTVMASTRRFLAEAKTEDISLPNGPIKCKITSNTPPDEIKFSNRKSSYTLTLKGGKAEKKEFTSLQIKTTITMPGKIIKTSAGVIKGNKVILNGLNFLIDGFTITAQKEGPGISRSDSTPSSDENKQPATAKKSFGLPIWGWVGIGVGGLTLVIGSISIIWIKKHKHYSNKPNSQTQHSSPGQYNGPPPPHTTY